MILTLRPKAVAMPLIRMVTSEQTAIFSLNNLYCIAKRNEARKMSTTDRLMTAATKLYHGKKNELVRYFYFCKTKK